MVLSSSGQELTFYSAVRTIFLLGTGGNGLDPNTLSNVATITDGEILQLRFEHLSATSMEVQMSLVRDTLALIEVNGCGIFRIEDMTITSTIFLVVL